MVGAGVVVQNCRCELVADMRMRLARTALPTGVAGALTQGAGMRNVFGGRHVPAAAVRRLAHGVGGHKAQLLQGVG